MVSRITGLALATVVADVAGADSLSGDIATTGSLVAASVWAEFACGFTG
jgi:hypothetical protein